MGQGYAICSHETLMASIDKNAKMSTFKKIGAQAELSYKLFGARGHLRSELKGITYCDYKNLVLMAAKNINTIPSLHPAYKLWVQILEELKSMEDEFAPKASDPNNPNGRSESSEAIKLDDEGVVIPNPKAAIREINNTGEQNFRGLINQSG